MLTWKMVLREVYDTQSKEDSQVKATPLGKKFNVTTQEINKRLNNLRSWGYIKYFDAEVKKRRYKSYEITTAGIKLVQKWEKSGEDLTKGKHFLKRCAQCTHAEWKEKSEFGKKEEEI